MPVYMPRAAYSLYRQRLRSWLQIIRQRKHRPGFGVADLLKFIGPGLLVTVGFIDPGNWASNLAAGAQYGYALLWMITLSTIMLIILQHNVAHLGIATGLCLSEAATLHLSKPISRSVLGSAMLASVSTSLAEILGAAIALNMLFHIPIRVGAVFVSIFTLIMLFTNSYRAIEKWIIGFVSIIGLSFIYELALVDVDWNAAAHSWITPSIPQGSMVIVMSVLGAVVMPHNLFLHSEIIQSRQWNLKDETIIKRQLDFEFIDTLFSMIVGWAINSAMILLAAAAFFSSGIVATELQQAHGMLRPLLGNYAPAIFAIALLFSGISSTITSGMAAGSIFSGFFGEPYHIKDNHSAFGVAISLLSALALVFAIGDPFKGLIYSQMALSIQLPITIFLQIYLTSSKKVMKQHANGLLFKISLLAIGVIVAIFNVMLLISFFRQIPTP
jgi:manganese transport protein